MTDEEFELDETPIEIEWDYDDLKRLEDLIVNTHGIRELEDLVKSHGLMKSPEIHKVLTCSTINSERIFARLLARLLYKCIFLEEGDMNEIGEHNIDYVLNEVMYN
jgi:hypothetical protein